MFEPEFYAWVVWDETQHTSLLLLDSSPPTASPPTFSPPKMRRKQMSTSRFVAHFSVSSSFYFAPHYSALPQFGWQSAEMTSKPGLLIRHVSQNNKSVSRVSNPLLESTVKNSLQLNITQSAYVTSTFFFLPSSQVCVCLACSWVEY